MYDYEFFFRDEFVIRDVIHVASLICKTPNDLKEFCETANKTAKTIDQNNRSNQSKEFSWKHFKMCLHRL